MSKKMRAFMLIVLGCIALSITSIANAVSVTIQCSNGYTVTQDCGDECLEVNCLDRTWSCESCPCP